MPTLNDAVQALASVNRKFNVDKAKECLAHFNVGLLSKLPDDKRKAFIDHCATVCA